MKRDFNCVGHIEPETNGKGMGERIDFLREATTALLDEVRSLTPFLKIKLEKEMNFDEEVKNFEVHLIERALEKTGGNQREAARLLKLKHTTLHSKIKRYEINIKDLTGNAL